MGSCSDHAVYLYIRAIPFKGTRVYVRAAMGIPGSEVALEELLCRVLGDLIEEGVVCKIADNLFCGGQTLEELYDNWERVLYAMKNLISNFLQLKLL